MCHQAWVNFLKNKMNILEYGGTMKTYRIEEELTSGWHELDANLTKDEASAKLNKLIEQGYNPNRLRVRTLLTE